jgi:hypothetical protein
MSVINLEHQYSSVIENCIQLYEPAGKKFEFKTFPQI